jgi:hypothetical protein
LTGAGIVSANTAVLAMDHHNIDPALDRQLTKVNILLSIVFIVEMVTKMAVFTRREFNTAVPSPFNAGVIQSISLLLIQDACLT